MKSKQCAECKETKSLDQFYIINNKIDYYCKYCRGGHSIRSHKRTTEKSCSHCGVNKHYAKGFCKNCYTRNQRNGSPELVNWGREVYPNRSTRKNARKNQLMHRYKLTVEKYQEMAANGCHICGGQYLNHKELHVDHDHKHCNSHMSCGLCVRGILCDACNVAVDKYERGILRNDYRHREPIVSYVEMHDKLISAKIKQHDKEHRKREG